MLRVLATLVLATCIAATAAAAPGGGYGTPAEVARVQRAPRFKPAFKTWTRTRIEAAAARVEKLKRTLKDPASRRKLIGKVALGAMTIGVGEVIDLGLRAHGMPPLAAAFLSGAAPTAMAHYAQRALGRIAPRYVDAPAPHGPLRVAGEAVFAGTVGAVGQIGLDKLGDVVGKNLHADQFGAFGRLASRVTMRVGKGVAAAATWAGRKALDQGVSRAAGSGRALASGWSGARMSIRPGEPALAQR